MFHNKGGYKKSRDFVQFYTIYQKGRQNEETKKQWALLTVPFLLCLLILQSNDSYAEYNWDKQKGKANCLKALPQPLIYHYKACVEGEINGGCAKWEAKQTAITTQDFAFFTPPQEKGLGKCCTFDDGANVMDKIIINTGNTGCGNLLAKNPGARHWGIWWPVSDGYGHYSMDWWTGP